MNLKDYFRQVNDNCRQMNMFHLKFGKMILDLVGSGPGKLLTRIFAPEVAPFNPLLDAGTKILQKGIELMEKTLMDIPLIRRWMF
jgi:hypothetical protein